MSDNQPATPLATEPESLSGKGKSGRFWRVFWLAFLVVSLAYAWYSFYAPSNEIAWAESFTVAQQQAEASEKPILLFVTAEWCSPCQIMKRQVWADDQVMGAVNSAFIPVMIDMDDSGSAGILRRYGVGFTPTTIITDSAGNVLQRVGGRISQADFLLWLRKLDAPARKSL